VTIRRPQHPFRYPRAWDVRILNGVSYHGILRASGATFLVFLRLCPALDSTRSAGAIAEHLHFHARLNGVGEDGPTHQPVETVSALRLIRHLDVIRPADPEETAGAFVAACERIDGPTLLALTRQNVPNAERDRCEIADAKG